MRATLNTVFSSVNDLLIDPAGSRLNNSFMTAPHTTLTRSRLLSLAKEHLGISSPAEFAKKADISIQTLENWKHRPVPPSRYQQIADLMKISVDQLLGRQRQAPKAAEVRDEVSPNGLQLTQEEEDTILAYRCMPEDVRTAVWDLMDGYTRRSVPSLDKMMGPRNLSASLAAQRHAIAKNIVAMSKELSVHGKPTKRS